MSDRLTLVVADDHLKWLEDITLVLAHEFEVIAIATDGEAALDLVCFHKPDVAVIDLSIRGLNGIEFSRKVTQPPFDCPTVICSIETDSEIADACREAGASGYVVKTRIYQDLVAAVRSAAERKPFFHAKTTDDFAAPQCINSQSLMRYYNLIPKTRMPKTSS